MRCLPFLILFLCACTKQLDPKDHTFYYSVRENIKSLDPVVASDHYSQEVAGQIYEGLYHYHYLKRPLSVEPLLADGPAQISPDGKEYIFKIKRGVYFHDDPCFPEGKGREVKAQDFVESWKRVAHPKTKSESYWVFQGKILGLDQWRENISQGKGRAADEIEGLKALDEYTLQVRLTQPYPHFLYVLAMNTTAVMPKEAFEYYQGRFGSHPVGTGPFRLQSWIRGSRVTLVKNARYREDYYPTESEIGDSEKGLLKDAGQKIPFLDRVVIYEIIQEQPRWLMLLKGDLDLLMISKDYIPEIFQKGQVTAEFSKKGMSVDLPVVMDVVFTAFNTENPFLKNKKLRQAISLTFDYATTNEKFYSGLSVRAQGPIPPNVFGFDEKLKNTFAKYDLKRAKSLLAEAGYPGGKGLPVFNYEMASSHATARQMAEEFQQQLNKIGVKVKLTPNTWPQFMEKTKRKKADMFDMAWNADYPDAESFLQLFYSKNISPGPNSSNFSNPLYDRLYEQMTQLPLGPEREAIYRQMEEILLEQAPWIYKVSRLRPVGRQAWVQNYKSDMLITDFMKYLRIDGDQRAEMKKNF